MIRTPELLKAIWFISLWAVMASSLIVESDAYRFATILLVGFSVICCRDELRIITKDWLAILCWAWAAYVLVRFIVGIALYGERGSSEWLYIFPLFFPGLGIALYRTKRHIFTAATVIIIAGLVMLLFTVDFQDFRMGERIYPLLHNNPIHAGVGCGMLFISSIGWMLYAAESGRLRDWRIAASLAIGSVTAIICLVAIVGAQSKGVWLALLVTVVFSSILALLLYSGRWRLVIISTGLGVVASGLIVARDDIIQVAGPTIEATTAMVSRSITMIDPLEDMRTTVDDIATPASMRERLKLWSNSFELIQSSPWIGWGNLWLQEWRQTSYSDTRFTLLHNGYLEIVVRHGALGLLVLTVFVLTSIKRIQQAYRAGKILPSAVLYIYSLGCFFFITIASNSNNRLAIGESFFLVMAAAVFSITLMITKPVDAT